MRVKFFLEKMQIVLSKDQQVFTKFRLDTLTVQQKHNAEVEAEIHEIGLFPYPEGQQ
jgi:hypothetical protein